jgi:hypothetical protein
MEGYRSPASAFSPMIFAATMLVSGCDGRQTEKAGAILAPEHITTESLASRYASPDDWHRLALYGNWDGVEEIVWRTIVLHTDCDQATALAIFWKASPEYYVEFKDRSSVPTVNLSGFDLTSLIRERWQSGAYVRSELAFDPDTDAWPLDFDDLRRRHGARVDQIMPPTMRVRLEGRRLTQR